MHVWWIKEVVRPGHRQVFLGTGAGDFYEKIKEMSSKTEAESEEEVNHTKRGVKTRRDRQSNARLNCMARLVTSAYPLVSQWVSQWVAKNNALFESCR